MHLIVNTRGELLSFALTAGNVADNSKAFAENMAPANPCFTNGIKSSWKQAKRGFPAILQEKLPVTK
ncbi:MAG: hypothetical protein ICV81_03825 [Flavisolibacter sp.]|nr:hypothetical protein [Flavisolibacter sp.]